jgi:TIR domain
MARIAISYRRDDSAAITGRIFDRLVTRYGAGSVFRDVDNIPLGVDFREHVSGILAQTDITLVVVGKRWFGPLPRRRRRIDDPADPVRVEVEAALRNGMPVVPLLVEGGAMPNVDQLPDSLREFVYRNGLVIDSGRDFDQHIERLTRNLEPILVQRAEEARHAEEERQRAEAARQAEDEKRQAEAARQAEDEKRQAEAARQTEYEKRRAEAARQAEDEKRRAQAARQAEDEKRRAEAARRAKEERQRAEAARQAAKERQQAQAMQSGEEARPWPKVGPRVGDLRARLRAAAALSLQVQEKLDTLPPRAARLAVQNLLRRQRDPPMQASITSALSEDELQPEGAAGNNDESAAGNRDDAMPAGPWGPRFELDPQIIAQLSEQFSGQKDVYAYPRIPPKMEANARSALRVSQDEFVWILFDYTLFSGATNCLLATRHGIFHRQNSWSNPVAIGYENLASAAMADAIFGVKIGNVDLGFGGGNITACRDFLRSLQSRLKHAPG